MKKVVMPKIGYGTFPQKDKLTELVPLVLDNGYSLIDTSDNYYNENYIGDAFKNEPQLINSNVIVISKFSQPLKTIHLKKCFQESKKKLNNKLDIYLLHWPYPFLWKKQWKKIEKLYLDGECKGIGVCNFDKKHIEKLLTFCNVKPIVNQIECHPMFQQKEIVEICKKNEIQIMSYSPIARKNSELMESVELKNIAKKYNKTVGQVILRWNLENDNIPIPGSTSLVHIKENFDIFDFSLDCEDLAIINSLEKGKRVRYDPNKRFSKIEKIEFLIYSLIMNIASWVIHD